MTFSTDTSRGHSNPSIPAASDAPAVPVAPGEPPDAGPRARRRPTRISSLHIGLIVAAVVLVLLVVFLIQNSRTVDVTFFGARLRVSLAVAMLLAAVAGALVTGAAGTARIAQLRKSMRGRAHAIDR
jgi:uncharacterized integral membrane protein